MSVRVRYAPSPTGYQHIGGARTALFNYFFARSQGGKFLLRVEDTDQERTFDLAMQDLYDTMQWLGIAWDEGPVVGGDKGPYIQSERKELYQSYAKKLIDEGKAYYCYCTSGRLDRIRKIQEQNSLPPGYDRHCRNLSEEELAEAKATGVAPVVRLKTPLTGSVMVHDTILGDISRDAKDINPDVILLKSDGMPTYHLANVIDDHLMEITHVLRAQEWVPSAPVHKLIYEAFGWQMPQLCHLPMVMGSDGQKLSKRHGATSVKDFIAKGYLPEALTNYISLLGWSYDDSREFFTKEELEQLFKLERINKAPAVFDYKKLDWFNGQYIRKLSPEEFFARVEPFLSRPIKGQNDAGEEIILEEALFSSQPDTEQLNLIKRALPMVQERITFLNEVGGMLRFLLVRPEIYPVADALPKGLTREQLLDILAKVKPMIADFMAHEDEINEQKMRDFATTEGIKIGALLQPLRVAVTGSKVSPPLFGSIRLLGSEETLLRLDNLIAQL
ncbi:glutamate--tRNA ligase [Entomospira culicis]|uniref:Glutamate--tRNA ligase n=1 Tax=Entomospira culicis TaxID=2719989 RepID=A0A968KZL6_9SPIO|nr:glutamate--tRNA ligase [Entomospira culicis]NIZ19624.1 glutamate--tRNA ligase [Entomospira culicis]NIZ69471.1 glutamate--tRNA ligase [Entomospira culicis]WDI36586.1 glutamate--tRNA ligase [Entomospira culicis]WDI38214.1 glutamate--tRNA ligase [Entomospira culicis]